MAEGIGGDSADGVVGLDQLFFNHLDGDTDGGEACAFSVTGLEHEKAALLNGELEILHVVEVTFEGVADILELAEDFRHFDLKLGDWFGGTDTGHDVFALGIEEEFPVENFFACGGISGEGDT